MDLKKFNFSFDKVSLGKLYNDWVSTGGDKIKASVLDKKNEKDNNIEELDMSCDVLSQSSSIDDNLSLPVNKDYPVAEAGLMMALLGRDAARGNDGTELYQYIFRSVLDKENFRSCSEGVAAAIRWAGLDDNFPPGGPATQLDYVKNHPDKWVSVNYNGDISKLQPGDIFINEEHVFMYVGSELLHKYFPDAPSEFNVVQASYNVDYQNIAESFCAIYRDDLNNERWFNNAFRNVKKEDNSKYSNIMPSS